jgi:serine/threonine protein kinase
MPHVEFRKNGQLLFRQTLSGDLSFELPDVDQPLDLQPGQTHMVGDIEVSIVAAPDDLIPVDMLSLETTGETPRLDIPTQSPPLDESAAFATTYVGPPDKPDPATRVTQDGNSERKYFLSSARVTQGVDGQDNAPPDSPHLEGYHITSKLGQGGMGAVWRAVQLGTGREVAIKTMQMARISQEAKTRFGLEIEVTAQLDHPNIGRLYESRLDDHLCFYAMELIEGSNLEDLTEKGPKLPDRTALILMEKVCRAVGFAHQKGIMHRDLKPGNIMLTASLEPKVVDFGLAKLVEHDKEERKNDSKITSDGSQLGTPAYMSPEQVRADQTQIDTRSDVYALGVILYEMLIGQHPHGLDGTLFALFTRIMIEDIRPPRSLRPDLPRDLEALLIKALAKNPADRYATAGELADEIRRYLDGEPLLAQPQTAVYVLKKKILKHKGKFLLAAAFVVLSLIGAVSSYIVVRRERDAAEDARKEAVKQRGIADEQRARADERFTHVRSLAQVFIHDFDDKLREGPTQARALLVTTAGDYLKKLSQDAADRPDLMLDIGRAYRKIGEVQLVLQSEPGGESSSRLQEAIESFQLSLSNFQTLLASSPNNPDLLIEMAATHQKISDTLRAQGDLTTAIASASTALSLLRPLTESLPDDPRPPKAIAASLLALGLLTKDTGDTKASIQHYTDALKILDAYNKKFPNDTDALLSSARAHTRLSNAYRSEGDPKQLELHLDAAASTLSTLSGLDPNNTEIKLEENSSHSKYGDFLLDQGRLADALSHYQKNVEIPQALTQADPKNTRYQNLLASGHRAVGLVAQRQGLLDLALTHYASALQGFQALSDADPQNARLTQDLTWLLIYKASAASLLDKLSEAITSLERARDLISPVAKNDASNTRVQRLYTLSLVRLGAAQTRAGLSDAAIQTLADAHKHITQTISQKDEPYSQHILSLVLREQARLSLTLNQPAEALPLLIDSLRIMDAVAQKSPDDQELREDISRALLLQAQALTAVDRFTDAPLPLQRAYDLLSSMTAIDPTNAQAQAPLLDVLSVLIDIGLNHPQPPTLDHAKACDLLRKALALSPLTATARHNHIRLQTLSPSCR